MFKFAELLKLVNIKEAFVDDYLSQVIMISIQTFFLYLKEERERRSLNAEKHDDLSKSKSAQQQIDECLKDVDYDLIIG